MNQSLYLESDNKLIGVIRNPYERAVSLYKLSYYWVGFDKWLLEENPATQCSLYEDCDYIIHLENWREELEALGVPTNNSFLEKEWVSTDYKRWYTTKSLNLVTQLYHKDIKEFGYSY